jgi:hypothetical protein
MTCPLQRTDRIVFAVTALRGDIRVTERLAAMRTVERVTISHRIAPCVVIGIVKKNFLFYQASNL